MRATTTTSTTTKAASESRQVGARNVYFAFLGIFPSERNVFVTFEVSLHGLISGGCRTAGRETMSTELDAEASEKARLEASQVVRG